VGKISYNRKHRPIKYTARLVILLLIWGFQLSTAKAQAREFGSINTSKSKKKKNKFDPSRLRYGGSLGATFGDITFVEVSPTVGYLFTDKILAGIGGRYMYYEERFRFFSYKTNIYGGSVFGQYFFHESILGHTEIEILNLDDRIIADERANVTSFFVGGGYRSMISDRSFASILILFNLTKDANTPYPNPVVRVNFGFGI
jgi:hypothetical protein